MHFIATFDSQSFRDTFVSYLSAFVFGTLIGAERQYRQRTAGLRTNALVALGAAAFVDLAQHLAGSADAVRVIAYVVSGVGFLGAGVIMKDGANVRGLNTAATLWCSAAVGACAGTDMVAEAGMLTLFIIAGNTLLRPLVKAIDRIPVAGPSDEATYSVSVLTDHAHAGLLRDLLVDRLEESPLSRCRGRPDRPRGKQCGNFGNSQQQRGGYGRTGQNGQSSGVRAGRNTCNMADRPGKLTF